MKRLGYNLERLEQTVAEIFGIDGEELYIKRATENIAIDSRCWMQLIKLNRLPAASTLTFAP
ncbi:MAG: hypothetical protein GY845_00005 [Planctomycetes bacterium]|nr:hypothetical protein [Planctomycetota bacterium]